MTDYKQMTRMLSAELLRKECRLSERQMRLIKWEQIEQGKLKLRQREVELSEPLAKALDSVPSHTKRHLKVDEKRHFCLKVFCKKALLFNEKALLFKKFILKNCTNYLKRIKNKNALNGRAFCLWA